MKKVKLVHIILFIAVILFAMFGESIFYLIYNNGN